MEYLYLVRNEAQLAAYQAFAGKIRPRIEDYIRFLRQEFGLSELPRALIFTDFEIATGCVSDIPVPAYTNDFRIIFTPELQVWQQIYLHQLDGLEESPEKNALRDYYSYRMTENHILQILGHELAHHIDLFEDGDDESGIWFEEGMAEYISRRYFLTPEEFRREAEMNRRLVALLEPSCGNHPLKDFGQETYAGDYAGIFYEYWRAFGRVSELIFDAGGDVHAVFTDRSK